jgi:cytochrome c oxidase subunit 2
MSYLLQDPIPLPKSPPSNDAWLPLPASTVSGDIDGLFDFLFWMSAVLGIGIMVAMTWFAYRYRAGSRAQNEVSEKTSDHNTALEITWSVIPLLVSIAIFVWGFKGYVTLRATPKDALEIHATAQKWKWLFTYPNGLQDDKLHVPVDRDVRIIIQSMDVLHSLFIPAFRVKMDAVPGRYTELWFHATETGDFPIFCAEYCGTAHSDMLSHTIVHPPGGYEEFLREYEKKLLAMPPVELGKLLYETKGCSACHTTDGTAKIGPSWKGVFGKQEALADGSSVPIDENYLRESIIDPQAKIVNGFPPSMPAYKGQLNDQELTALVEYIKSLK